MTLQQMQAASRERLEAIMGAWTDKPTGKTRLLLKEYRRSYLEINQTIKDAYAKHLTGINPELYESELIKYGRLESMQNSIAKSYNNAARAAGLQQFQMSELAMTNLYYQNQYSLNWFVKAGYYSVLDQKALEVSVYGTEKIWQSIKASNRTIYKTYLPQYGTLISRLNANATKDLDRISSAITRGLRQGRSYTAVSRELQTIFNTTASNALRIARTEGNRNLNSGSYANSQAAMDAGINLSRQYMATLDTRTREQSAGMDGQRKPANQPFSYGGLQWYIPGNSGNPAYDINDRCTVIDIVDDQNPELRRGRNPVTNQTEVTSFRYFDDWARENNLRYNTYGRLVSV